MKTEKFNDITIIIGQNAQENWDMIDFNSNHIWLHLNSFPSCHVIIQQEEPEPEVITYAAELCKVNTKYRNLKDLKVCYTECNNLKKGDEVGCVEYKSNKKVKIIKI